MSKKIDSKAKAISKPIIILAVLSVLGFMCSAVSDLSYFTGIEAFINDAFEEGNPAKEVYAKNIQLWKDNGVDTSIDGLSQIKRIFLILGILNIPVLLGVALMFFRVRVGFELYAISQLAYIVVPFYFFGFGFYSNFRVLGIGDLFIMILFILMWGIQRKNLGNSSSAKSINV
ncbi:hypothetical protein OAW23_00360 [Flavobacteriales bacterium]|nr:hypothetical protein [Flavobacteriales bacterium]